MDLAVPPLRGSPCSTPRGRALRSFLNDLLTSGEMLLSPPEVSAPLQRPVAGRVAGDSSALQRTNTSLLRHLLQASLASVRMCVLELVTAPTREEKAPLRLGAARRRTSALVPAVGHVAPLCGVEG